MLSVVSGQLESCVLVSEPKHCVYQPGRNINQRGQHGMTPLLCVAGRTNEEMVDATHTAQASPAGRRPRWPLALCLDYVMILCVIISRGKGIFWHADRQQVQVRMH